MVLWIIAGMLARSYPCFTQLKVNVGLQRYIAAEAAQDTSVSTLILSVLLSEQVRTMQAVIWSENIPN